jgi:hypothetical protein
MPARADPQLGVDHAEMPLDAEAGLPGFGVAQHSTARAPAKSRTFQTSPTPAWPGQPDASSPRPTLRFDSTSVSAGTVGSLLAMEGDTASFSAHDEPTVAACCHVRCGTDKSDSVSATLVPVVVYDDIVPAMRVAVVIYDGVFDSGLTASPDHPSPGASRVPHRTIGASTHAATCVEIDNSLPVSDLGL